MPDNHLTFDIPLFSTVIVLSLFGLVMVYSSSAMIAMEDFGSTFYFLMRQSVWVVLGMVALIVCMNVDYTFFSRPSVVYGMILGGIVALVATLFAQKIHGARRWIFLGPLSVQPSEFMKPVIIIFLAYYINRKKEELEKPVKFFLPVVLIVGVVITLIFIQPDLGGATIILGLVGTMLFLGGVPWRYCLIFLLISGVVLALGITNDSYRMDRIKTFINPHKDIKDDAFQISQSMIAIGSGGLLGKGLAEGKQKLFFLPEPHTDFIYSVICEELGFVGGVVIILAYMIVFWRGVKTALQVDDNFAAMLALGLTVLIVFQAMINIGVSLGTLPTTGTSLPFISYGGSSLLTFMISGGIVLNVSQHSK